ncbi:alkaline phosphatase [Pseudoalteromonas fenneropenaei]|uniref:Alkaline phosphatase n=1 Tax=Pseudoalteromonas fenneropenaei TaxID=1737459 RepID=A0ABV7CKA6_9GAMM
MKKSVLALSVSALLLTACNDNSPNVVEVVKEVEVIKEVPVTPTPVTSVKNVILMIGDGMGPQQVGLLEDYARRAPNSTYNGKGNLTALSKLADNGHLGLALNQPYGATSGKLVVDSACSATQLATGKASGSEMIGLDEQGFIVETILEKAKKAGKATGLVSDTRITHATPAAFAAHQAHRSLEGAIAVELVTSGSVDVLLSGGAREFVPADIKTNTAAQQAIEALGAAPSVYKKSKRKDSRNLLVEAKEQHGYSLAFDKTQLANSDATKLLGLFANSGMADAIAYKACSANNSCTEPSLKEMTVKALDILAKDPDGFFLMVEGGQIDWAGHANDAGWMLNELLKFDEAVEAVYQWVKDRNDTLVVVTADHETGSFGFSYSRKDLQEGKDLPGDGMHGAQYKPNFNFGNLSNLDMLYKQTGTFFNMMDAANANWDFASATASDWMNAINKYSEYKVNIDQAAKVGEREVNDYYAPDHSYQSATMVPKFEDFKEFYVYADEDHTGKIARALAADQNVVWGTGTHTAAPVPVYAFGPEGVTKAFSTMQHHTDLANKMMVALGVAE